MSLFKYRSGEAAQQSLIEGTVFFATPSTLNDTLEAKYEDSSAEEFSRVIVETVNEISCIRSGIAFERDRQLLAEFRDVNARENERLRTFADQIGIFSAAQRPDHQAMWAYYADNAKGVCFEMDWTKDLIQQHQIWASEVQYHDRERTHNRADDWRAVFLELSRSYPDASLDELIAKSLDEEARRKWGILTASRAVSVKHTDWAHEQEIRLLAPKSGAMPILKDVLKRVHFVRYDGEFLAEIMGLLHRKYPSVEVVQWKFSHGSLAANPTPMDIRIILA